MLLAQVQNTLERFKNRFTLDDPRFIEHYLENKKEILLRFSVEGFPEEFLAHMQGINGPNRQKIDAGTAGLVAARQGDPLRNACTKGEQRSVFVDYIQPVQDPEFVCPSFIRLGGVDSINRTLRHSLYWSRLSGLVFQRAIEDRILDVPERVLANEGLQASQNSITWPRLLGLCRGGPLKENASAAGEGTGTPQIRCIRPQARLSLKREWAKLLSKRKNFSWRPVSRTCAAPISPTFSDF